MLIRKLSERFHPSNFIFFSCPFLQISKLPPRTKSASRFQGAYALQELASRALHIIPISLRDEHTAEADVRGRSRRSVDQIRRKHARVHVVDPVATAKDGTSSVVKPTVPHSTIR